MDIIDPTHTVPPTSSLSSARLPHRIHSHVLPPPPPSLNSSMSMPLVLVHGAFCPTSPPSTPTLTIPTSPYPCVRLLQPSRSHSLPHRLTFFASDAGSSLSQQRAVLTSCTLYQACMRSVAAVLPTPRLWARRRRLSPGLATEGKVSSIDHLNLTHHATLPTPASPIITFISVSSPQRRSSSYHPSPLTLLLLSSPPLRAL